MINPIAYCDFEGAKWLFFGPNVEPIIYYSHLPIIIISSLIAILIYFQNRKALSNKILFYTILAFVIWVVCDAIYWASNRSDVIMFVWAIDILVETLVYIGALYLMYSIIDKRDISFNKKLLLGALYLPILIALPTVLVLSDFDVFSCLATEGFIAKYYTYFVEIFVSIWVICLSIKRYLAAKEPQFKKEILFLSVGTILLLVAFGWGNITGSFTDDWRLGQYGLFGMPIFLGFLTYSIVKFKTFDIKLIGAQALVWALVMLVGSQFFYLSDSSVIVKVLTAITLIVSSVLGLILIRSIKEEIYLNEQLESANAGQTNLIHIMNHQIKGHLGVNKNIFAELLTDDYGKMPAASKPLLEKGLQESDLGVQYVTAVLRGASAENGTLPYEMNDMDFKTLVAGVVEKQKEFADKKGLHLSFDVAKGEYNITGDSTQLGEAIKNLIDNSISYTPKGNVWVALTNKNNKIILSVKDTGVGIKEEDKPKIFKAGGVGKDSIKINVNSSGYGLAFVKGVVEAHKGKIWFESDGAAKGSTFFVELPITQ